MSLLLLKNTTMTEANGGAPSTSVWGQLYKRAGQGLPIARTLFSMPSGVHPASPMFPGMIGRVGSLYGYSVPVVNPDLYWMGQVPFDAQKPAATETAWDRATRGT